MSERELVLELEDDASPPKAGSRVPQDPQWVDELLEHDEPGSDPFLPQRRGRTRRRPSSPRLLVYRFLNGLVDRVQGSRLGLAVLAFVIGASSLVVWYSLIQRGSLIHLGYEIAAERQQMVATVDELRLAIAKQDFGDVMAGVSRAESRIFTDYRQLASWLSAQHQYAERLTLNFSYTLGTASPSQVKNVLEVPIAVEVAVTPETDGHGYVGMLEFLKTIIDARWYIEIVSASLSGEAAGANEMKANLQVWVQGTTEEQTTVSAELQYEEILE